VATDPEELLRSIERTREEVAHTVDTIAGRLDPKRAAKRGAAHVRSRVEEAAGKLRTTRPKDVAGKVSPYAKRVSPYVTKMPKPALGAGLAALVAIAAIVASRRKR
jgi:hypothetical protein